MVPAISAWWALVAITWTCTFYAWFVPVTASVAALVATIQSTTTNPTAAERNNAIMVVPAVVVMVVLTAFVQK